ncbi:MAG: tetratricopeptide repeat protein [Proteobacteria bacterium]|nr:tetratricopeptide repeat protein [Desulfobulbaceae bacterium]MBU4151643.1 tetratricopeptide repeat protein [Pseudomonadota bacterium]
MLNTRPWIALVVVVLVVLGPVIGHEFLDYDDAINITSNPEVTKFSLEGLLSFWLTPYVNLYIPVTYNLWALLAKASGVLPGAVVGQLNPALFHGVNLLLHLAGASMVFLLLSDLFRAPWAAWAGAVLFAIHPVQVESVAWVTGMKDVLSGFFSLMALWFLVRYVREDGEEGNRWGWYLAAAIFFLLAMLSKPGAVATPALAWIIGVLLLGRRPVRALFDIVPWVVLAAPIVMVTRVAQAEPHHVYQPALWQRILVAGDSLSFYLGKLLLPVNLAPDYGRTPEFVLDHGWSYLTGVFPYLLAVLLLWKGSRPCRAATGIFVCVLLPVSGIIPFVFQQISTVADRYLYLAMLGPALALTWVLAPIRSKAVWAGVVVVLALFAGISMAQIRFWHEPRVFYDHALKVNPRSWTAYNNLGNILAESNQPGEAIVAYEKAIAIDPDYAEAYNNLGTTYASLKHWEKSINAFVRAMEINPYYVDAAINLGDAYRANAQHDEAIAAYEWAIDSGSSTAKVYYSLCTLYHELSHNEEAASCYNKFLAIKPDSAEGYNNLGTVYKDLNRNADAIDAYHKALTIRPEFAEVYNNLGFLFAAEQKFAEAIRYYRKAAELYPDHPLPTRNLALALIALGQSDEAIAWLKKAISVDPTFAPAYNDLSRLYFARKEYRQSVTYGVRARELGLIDEDHWQTLVPYLNHH